MKELNLRRKPMHYCMSPQAVLNIGTGFEAGERLADRG
jgi:hypothetical protein